MMNVNSSWHGDDAYKVVVDSGWDRIRRAVVFFWQSVQTALNVSNPRPYRTPSQPGEPPRKRTGFLAANVKYELGQAQMKGRVGIGANALYGLFLETGTKWMAARPWLQATLDKVIGQLRAIIGG
ncbi:MAG: hypothetical protein K2R98_08515 [Gemmataceae bacterium]|nr:hypothetical protein [Gemmataceae bacterium]